MSYPILLNLPEEIYSSLIRIAQQTGRTPEELAIEGIKKSVKAHCDDPVEEFIGAFNSQIDDWTENHDEYLGKQHINH